MQFRPHDPPQQRPLDVQTYLTDTELQPIPQSPAIRTSLSGDHNENNNAISSDINKKDLKKSFKIVTTEVVDNLTRDVHIVVCGSPRVGKSTLINAICGREVSSCLIRLII